MENNNTTHQISHEAENSALQSANETPQKDGQPRCAVASGSALVSSFLLPIDLINEGPIY